LKHKTNRNKVIHDMNASRIVIVLMAGVFMLTGCAPKPSAGDAQSEIQVRINDPLKLISFEKTDGQDGQIQNAQGMVVPSYSLEYAADLEATKRCEVLLSEIDETNGFLTADSLADGAAPIYTNNVLESGQHLRINGTVLFEKTEKGWRENHITIYPVGTTLP
jgi:hypothetical protein